MTFRRFSTLLVLLLFLGPSFASEYGSLRISVAQANASHRTNVQLKLNGKAFAAFSHSLSSPIVKTVNDAYLADGTSTPMASDYGGLQAGCQFRFLIEYSFGGTAWIPLGSFEAPASQVSGVLPIGLCNGALCSSNATIKAKLDQLEDERWKKAGEALRKWLQEALDREARETLQQKRRIEAQKPPALASGSLPEEVNRLREEAVLADTGEDPSPAVSDVDAWWSKRVDAAVSVGSTEGLVSELDSLERFYDTCAAQGALVQHYCARYGGAAALVAMAEAFAIAYAVDPESTLSALDTRHQAMQGGPTLADVRNRVAEQRFQLQAAIDVKRSEAIWTQVGKAARAGLGFSPLNDVADFCEAVTGREFCISSGRVLSGEERLFAVLGMIAGNRQVWDALGDSLRARILTQSADPKALGQILEKIASNTEFSRKGAAHIFVGEFDSFGGSTFLRSGMHTEDSVQLFVQQSRSEGRTLDHVTLTSISDLMAVHAQGLARDSKTLYRFEGSNGVSIYMFPESSFLTGKSWSYNVVEFYHAGQPVIVEGAKTVFPTNWDYGKLSEAMMSVRDNPSNRVGFARLGTVDGVEIRVGVDNAGKIANAYPKIKLPE